jgi:hypothetical protein
MALQEPPVCSRCSDSPGSLEKLQQHANVLKQPKEQARAPARILEGSSGHISLEQPLSKKANFVTNDPLKNTSAFRLLPAWMSLLPSQKNAEIHPPKHSILQRRSTFPYFETTRMSTPQQSPAHTPPEDLSTASDTLESTPIAAPEKQSSRAKTRPRLPSSWIRPQLSSSNLSFLSFVDNQPEELDHHMDFVPKNPLCPSAYMVQPSINFSRPRRPSIAKSAPSVIDIPRGDNGKRIRKRLKKRFPVEVIEDVCAVPKIPERPQRTSRPWKLDWSRRTSPDESLEQWPKTHHTPEPNQDIEAAKLPFLKELSGFLAGRTGKWILPSRVGEAGAHRDLQTPTKRPSYSSCGCDVVSRDVCEGCQRRVDIPGSWV